MKEKIFELLSDIKKLEDKNLNECSLPNNVFYLNDTDILCRERNEGESRYPYEMDGLNLWVHSSGQINANESDLVIIRNGSTLQQESNVDFWGGIKNGESWIPVSITGITKQLFEPVSVSRHMIYSKRAAYFIAETENVIFALRVNVTSEKQINFTVSAINKTEEEQEIYIASYIDPHLRFGMNEDEWAPIGKRGKLVNGAYKIIRYSNPENNDLTNIAVINKKIISQNEVSVHSTVSKAVFMGERGRCLVNATSLPAGRFFKDVYSVNSSDLAIASDIIKLRLNEKEEAIADFIIDITHHEEQADKLMGKEISIQSIEEDIKNQEAKEKIRLSDFEMEFSKFKGSELNNVLFNRFLKNVQKQIDLCALGKNYAGNMLGVRDVFQQLTAASIWNKDDVRKKIVLCLNYIMSNGRAPRQFTVPPEEHIIPKFDIRQFIDQGLWVIETLHKYISRTGDISILEEKCFYYDIIDEKKALYKKSDCVDTVLDHLLKITEYLNSNIDDRTNCLKILYGDWNDAVCGLGATEDEGKEFGTGVSVMATLQHYKLLKEMCEILTLVGKHNEKCEEYKKIRTAVAEGLEKYAIQKDGERRHIVHGWGDKGSYNVGSLCDTDGAIRYSLTPLSFWCISEMIKNDPSIKEDILKAYDVLDSKYGLMTFDKAFPADMKGVGRIVNLTPGTFENACSYIHATTFAIMSLFIIGEPERAWEQIMKVIPLTHKSVSKTPFVMPNSYCYNEEFQMDGESMSDWYTGSGAVLMRCIYEYALGLIAELDGLKVATPNFVPCDNISVNTTIKGCKVKFVYKNTGSNQRKYFVNGAEQIMTTDELLKTKTIFIKNNDIKDNMLIEVID